jgi:hypothetical protein
MLIKLQGQEALLLLSTENDLVRFQVLGFHKRKFLIQDHRPGIAKCIEDFFHSGQADQFYRPFNDLAWVEIDEVNEQEFEVNIKPSNSDTPDYYLWIAIGAGEDLPVLDYQVLEEEAITQGNYATFAVFPLITALTNKNHQISAVVG